MAIVRPDDIEPWIWDATAELLREMERIDGEALSQGQLEQDHEASDFAWRREVAEIIGRHAGRCPDCNGSGQR